MNISINLALPDLVQPLIYLIIGLLVLTFITGLARTRLGLGYVAVLLLAIPGSWLFAHILKLQVFEGINLAGVPLIEATLGAVLFGLIGVTAWGRAGSRRYA